MNRLRGILLAGLAVLAATAGSGHAGNYSPPPGDCCPQWSPNGTQIVFDTYRGNRPVVGAVPVSGGPEQFIPGIPVGTRSPDWKHVAYYKDGWLDVSNVDGSDERMIAQTYGTFAWSPDS